MKVWIAFFSVYIYINFSENQKILFVLHCGLDLQLHSSEIKTGLSNFCRDAVTSRDNAVTP